MIATLKNNRSLSFYQNTPVVYSKTMSSVAEVGISSVITASITTATATTTTNFNNQLNSFLTTLHAQRDKLAQEVAQGLANDPNYTNSRSGGVDLAWEYEKKDVEMGGKGSGNWDKNQRKEILEKGRVRGQEGHHINNVADHPEDQGNPDNIEFLDRKKHLKAHRGNFRNETHGSHIDKDKMLKKTNAKRVVKNELTGIGLAAAIGAGVGFTIGFAVSLAQNGVSPDTIKNAFADGGKAGLKSGGQSVLSYGVGRTLGQLATKAVLGALENAGVEITENITQMCSMGVVGLMTIALFTTIEFVKLKQAGIATKDALIQVGKQALFSISLLALSIAAQGIWGGPAGLIVSISSGIILITVNIATTVHQRKLSDAIKIYTIEKAEPLPYAA